MIKKHAFWAPSFWRICQQSPGNDVFKLKEKEADTLTDKVVIVVVVVVAVTIAIFVVAIAAVVIVVDVLPLPLLPLMLSSCYCCCRCCCRATTAAAAAAAAAAVAVVIVVVIVVKVVVVFVIGIIVVAASLLSQVWLLCLPSSHLLPQMIPFIIFYGSSCSIDVDGNCDIRHCRSTQSHHPHHFVSRFCVPWQPHGGIGPNQGTAASPMMYR
jgi:hypothetical protein